MPKNDKKLKSILTLSEETQTKLIKDCILELSINKKMINSLTIGYTLNKKLNFEYKISSGMIQFYLNDLSESGFLMCSGQIDSYICYSIV